MSSQSSASEFIGRMVTVRVDRPLGSQHPVRGFRYPVNYGFVPGTLSADGEALDAYVLGVDAPLAEFTGQCIAIIERRDDRDDKLIVVPNGTALPDDELRHLTGFQEQFFDSEVIRSPAPARPIADPTPDLAVNALLSVLLVSASQVLGARFVGLYLHGSAATGHLHPQRSDLDFLVVTDRDLPAESLPALAAMHARITASGLPWATRLEGSYIPRAALRRHDPAHADHPALRVDGTFDVDHHACDWVIQRHVIREHGLALAGPPPRELIDPVGSDDLRRAARGILHEWWEPQLQDHSRLRRREYQAYAVLTMCRVLYTLEHGAVAPKPTAARWARQTLGRRWAGLIARALAWPDGPQADELNQTLDLIRATIDWAQRTSPAGEAHHVN